MVFAVAIVFPIVIIGNIFFGCYKLVFKRLSYEIIGLWILLWSLIHLCYYNSFPQNSVLSYWHGIREVFQQSICCCILSSHVYCSVNWIITQIWLLLYIFYFLYIVNRWQYFFSRCPRSISSRSIYQWRYKNTFFNLLEIVRTIFFLCFIYFTQIRLFWLSIYFLEESWSIFLHDAIHNILHHTTWNLLQNMIFWMIMYPDIWHSTIILALAQYDIYSTKETPNLLGY